MRHKPSVSAQNPDLHLIFSLQFLLLLSQSIDKYYSKPPSELPAWMCAKRRLLVHFYIAVAPSIWQIFANRSLVSYFFFSIFFCSHVYLLSFAPPSCSSPNSNQMLSIEDSATCRGEMYVPCCGFWR